MKFNEYYKHITVTSLYKRNFLAFTLPLIVLQYLKMAKSDKSNNTTIGKNILAIAKEKSFSFTQNILRSEIP